MTVNLYLVYHFLSEFAQLINTILLKVSMPKEESLCPHLYFASPLFTEMERTFNAQVVANLRAQVLDLTVFPPIQSLTTKMPTLIPRLPRYDTEVVQERRPACPRWSDYSDPGVLLKSALPIAGIPTASPPMSANKGQSP